MKLTIQKGLIHFLSLLVGYVLGFIVFADSPSQLTFAGVTAWWCSLYIGYIFKVGWRAIIPFTVLYFGLSMIDFIFALNIIQQGSSGNIVGHLIISLIGFVMMVSSILVNVFIRTVTARVSLE